LGGGHIVLHHKKKFARRRDFGRVTFAFGGQGWEIARAYPNSLGINSSQLWAEIRLI
jgi:hypothetical protein